MPEKKFPWSAKRGYPLPLGVTVLNEGINFALFSRHGSQVSLIIDLLSTDGQSVSRHEVLLGREENRTGDIWHVLLETDHTDFTYGYRIFGKSHP